MHQGQQHPVVGQSGRAGDQVEAQEPGPESMACFTVPESPLVVQEEIGKKGGFDGNGGGDFKPKAGEVGEKI